MLLITDIGVVHDVLSKSASRDTHVAPEADGRKFPAPSELIDVAFRQGKQLRHMLNI